VLGYYQGAGRARGESTTGSEHRVRQGIAGYGRGQQGMRGSPVLLFLPLPLPNSKGPAPKQFVTGDGGGGGGRWAFLLE